jgi:hypothetical protein
MEIIQYDPLINEVKDMTLPKAPQSVNADLMTEDEIHAKLQEGCDDIKAGKVQDAEQGMRMHIICTNIC